MTLGKYIKRLADKLDPYKKYEKQKTKENIRKARTNVSAESRFPLRPRFLGSQIARYGYCLFHIESRGKRGVKGASHRLLPRIKSVRNAID